MSRFKLLFKQNLWRIKMSKSISWMRNKAVMVGSAALLTAAMLALPGMGVVKAATPVNATVTIKTAVMDGGDIG
jgi:hypothetical protein